LIFVWDLNTMVTLLVMKGVLEKGVINACFSMDGRYFAASSLDEDHTLVVYDV